MSNFLIEVPDIGEGIAEVELVEWSVAIGETIEEDEVLCVVMTDKATVEIPSPVDGKVTWHACEEGEMIAVGADFVKLQVEGEGNSKYEGDEVADANDVIADAMDEVMDEVNADVSGDVVASVVDDIVNESQAIDDEQKITKEPVTNATTPYPKGKKPLAAPAVRQRAINTGVNLNSVNGTGADGCITHNDLDVFIAEQSSKTASVSGANLLVNHSIKEVKVIGLRRKIAAIMQDTMQRIPHFTYVEDIDVTELEKLRNKLNIERNDNQPKLTLLPFFIKALVIALQDYPQMSARFDDEADVVFQYGAAHVGIATQTDNGLLVPVIKHAEILDLWQSANEVKRLSTNTRNGKATREELSGSTITITSLGPMGGIVTTPVINSPEVVIIGINKMAKRPVWQDGGFVPRDIINVSSSFDHRVIDGWEAALFIQRIKSLLESPATLFM